MKKNYLIAWTVIVLFFTVAATPAAPAQPQGCGTPIPTNTLGPSDVTPTAVGPVDATPTHTPAPTSTIGPYDVTPTSTPFLRLRTLGH